ncbi:MAG: hypothetical protein B7Z60_00570 [Ferrovum sp. 37-45-19]|uniref:hypothetical protein n=1 Tax=Ferrovum sp. JA12 TaxID=1356299 RepID=UPI000702A2CE|nr:hypothetical protein [Ferrovum sp. JA12]OYV79851.1 MAG: hypothetical protein B7Z65_03860 [Ferrovum sp. 21-44-67]OYV95475.1 MAG: hypothetical protein B7Z60_00570 [Ferrovum sp. 37-45-19]OZB31521.1 MAG: hypothetical protein B7X47_09760 [Ferrovum sp. 34-44-207]HQT81271.1 hypothetical protein [Ferrovaceae bacterium]KRH78158.1 hypothetical protein FERRO_11380 [Ferrovum sp. JA12]
MLVSTFMVGIHHLNDAKLARQHGAQLIEAIHPTDSQSCMSLSELRLITKEFEDVCPVGAFCGEIPLESARWIEAIETLSAAAVDIIMLPIRPPGNLVSVLADTSHLTDLYPTCAVINPDHLPTELSMETLIAAIGGCHWMGICIELDHTLNEAELRALQGWIELIHESDLMAGLSVKQRDEELNTLEADFIRLPLAQLIS